MAEFNNQQYNTFHNAWPNAIFTGYNDAMPSDLAKLGVITDPISKKAYNITEKLPEKFIKVDKNIFNERNANCARSSIDTLIANTGNIQSETEGTMRCGWLYKPPINDNISRPQVSRGAYGMYDGPVISPAGSNESGAQWIWDLQEAKKRIEIDRCKALKTCTDVEHPQFIGCGFSKTLQRGIPVAENGVAKYRDAHAFSMPSQIITKRNQCPQPTAAETMTADGYQDSCKQLHNGKLSRDCIMKQVLKAGCTDKGTLYSALNAGNEFNYGLGIDQKKAYQVYNARAALRGKEQLSNGIIRDGNIGLVDALMNVNDIYDIAASGANDGFAFAARDLCLNAGEIDKYDWCSDVEVPESTRTPGISLECLRKRFLSIGGTPQGAMYPSSSNMNDYNNNYRTLGDIMNMWRARVAIANNSNSVVAIQARREIIGIPNEDSTVIK